MRLFYFCIISLLVVFPLYAQEVAVDDSALDDGVSSVYGLSCENIREGEAMSSARVRVTDKASFAAVQEVVGLKDFKKEVNDHDFNVLIYNIVDNYLEDMAVRTTSRDNEKICVEVTGYIQKNNIIKSINETLQKATAPDEEQEFESNPNLEEIITDATQKSKDRVPDIKDIANKIYLSPTEFFDSSKTEAYTPILQQYFATVDLPFVQDISQATYIISPKVLRAKVDPINKDTSRLQMVISMDMEIAGTEEKFTTHQNRFVLFTSSSGEQESARKLLEKLFAKAAGEISEKILQAEQKGKSSLPPVITPSKH